MDVYEMREVAPGEYESGDIPSILTYSTGVYGGWAIAAGINIAYKTVTNKYHLYSATGYFLSPVRADRKVHGSSRELRQTSNFATRLVELSQMLDSGEKRLVMVLTVDFHAQEPKTLLEYSAKPAETWPSHAVLESLNKPRGTPSNMKSAHQPTTPNEVYFDQKVPPKSIAGSLLIGKFTNPANERKLDPRAIHQITSADWVKTKKTMPSLRDSVNAAAFGLDGALATLPIPHSGLHWETLGVGTSLDFAFRVFRNDIHLDQWHLREVHTTAAAEARSYSEGRLWDERGNLVASMTQQSLLRPRKKVAGNASL